MNFQNVDIEINSLYCSSLDVRPGTLCDIEIVIEKLETILLLKNQTPYNLVIQGFTTLEALRFDKNVNKEKIVLNYDKDLNVTNIEIVDECLFEDTVVSFTLREILKLQSKTYSAFNNRKFYNYYELIDNKIYPNSIITFPYPENAVNIISIKIAPIFERNGVEYLDYNKYTMRSDGLLEWQDNKEFILTEGKKTIKFLKKDYSGPYYKQENAYVFVEYIDTSWQEGFTNANGILIYDDFLFVTTNKGLCVFDRYTNLTKHIFIDETIKDGLDMTIDEYDRLYVLYPDKVRKYKIRHDLCYIGAVESERRIYFKEKDPRFQLNIE